MVTIKKPYFYFFYFLFFLKTYNYFKHKNNKLASLLYILPYFNTSIKKKLKEQSKQLEDNVNTCSNEITKLPDNKTDYKTLDTMFNKTLTIDKKYISGIIYSSDTYDDDIIKIYKKYSKTNPLHPNIYPEVRLMEINIIDICKELYHGDNTSCGSVTSGGTESLLLTCLAYRDYCKYHKNIINPNIIAFNTVHPAFDKAAHYFNIRLIKVKTLKQMKKNINSNTICLIGSAPDYSYGLIDPLIEIGKLAKSYNTQFHIDACMGGFLLPFIDEFKYINFTIDGVTSISMDTHKYGYSPKGSSVLLFSDYKFKKFQHFINKDWCGGVYASPTIPGSKSGGVIAATWASLLLRGKNSFIETSQTIQKNQQYIVRYFRECYPDSELIHIIGKPKLNIIAFASNTLNIYQVIHEMHQKGWHLSTMQNPPAFHFCLSENHTRDICIQFCKDLSDCISFVNDNKDFKNLSGTLAIYGAKDNIDSSLFIHEIIHDYIFLLSQKTISFRY